MINILLVFEFKNLAILLTVIMFRFKLYVLLSLVRINLFNFKITNNIKGKGLPF